MKKLVLFALLLLNFSLFAQQANMPMNIGRLYGKVVDASSKEPVAYASVTVLRTVAGRDSLIGGALTIENGDFNITGLPMGMLKVKVSFIGNKDLIKMVKVSPPNSVEQDLGNLQMTVDAQVLNAVEVTAEKASTMISLEKRVFNVEKSLTSTGGTAEDVLKNVPSVTVDMDGNAKLRDRGTTIYVDGKPTLMSLTQIPADQIESVEVISNPSAKYEATATGGILNIVLKKNRKPGYNGVFALGAGTQGRYNGMLNLNAHEGKWNIGGFYNINSSDNPSTGYSYRTNRLTDGSVLNYFNQNTDLTFQNVFQIGRVNVDYALNNRNTISLSGTKVGGKFNISTAQDYEYLSPLKQITSYGTRTTEPRNNFKNNSVEAQWRKTYAKKDKSLTALANYGWGSFANAAAWNTTGYDNKGILLPNNPELVNIAGANKNEQAVFQLDYVNPINDSTKIEMGMRSFWSSANQLYFYNALDYKTNTYIQDNRYSQNNLITQNINAAYITYSGRFKNQINYQAGVRFEQSNLTGISKLDGTSNFGYDYPKGNAKDLMRSFFPALYLSKKLDATTELGLNFSRKLQRPNFRMLMPGIQGNDKQNIQIGNPNLQPEFVNLAELNYNKLFGKDKQNNWLATIYMSNETNTLKPLVRADVNDPSVLITTFVNGTNELQYGFDNTLKLGFGKNFEVMLNANVFNFAVNVDTFSNTGWAGNGKVNLTYRLPADFSVQLNGAYEGNRPMPQGTRQGVAYMDFAVKKSFFHNAANLTLSVSDVFNSRKEITIYDQPTYFQESMRRRDTRFVKLSLQVPFGKADASMFKRMKDSKKQGSGQEQPDFSGGGGN